MHNADSIIVLSDGEEDGASSNNDSVVIVEDRTSPAPRPVCVSSDQQEEELVITFSQGAQLLPHARYDCSIHTFTLEDAETSAPAGNNQLICQQCYCYICDRPAGECLVWTVAGMCHCNSHNRSVFWRSSRDAQLLGFLQRFSLTLLEVDPELRLAEALLLKLEAEIKVEYASFLMGTMRWTASCSCRCHTANQEHVESCSCQSNHQEVRMHDYLQVYQCVGAFLDRAEREEREKPRAAAVMRLGAAHFFLTHAHAPGMTNLTPQGNSEEGRFLLLKRVTEAVQRQLVMCDFNPAFSLKLQTFYQDLPLPPRCAVLRNSLRVRPWKDPLLVSVLLGQNVTGQGRGQGRGRKDVLTESAAVVLLRTHQLQLQNKYWELTRYLKVVQTDNSELVQAVRDLIPLYQCKSGNLTAALYSTFSPAPGPCCPACRMTPDLYHLYLRILTTATAPTHTLHLHTQPLPHTTVWEPIRGTVHVKRSDVVRFSLRILMSNTALYTDVQCWVSLLHVVNIPALPQPDAAFLKEAVAVTTAILLDRPGHVIPRSFRSVYPDQALLLLVTACLARCTAAGFPSSTLYTHNTYKENVWCMDWLCDRLSSLCPPSHTVKPRP
ncbi:uncharacterized protein zgc:112980 isoform X2 [Osmerus eperlanus]|uniref:uncharacterized protein zgc:112980 isoform X2 n=1 Tax=Osmerus eperlanus TaxID=29151 RepID=UPI002E0EAD7E